MPQTGVPIRLAEAVKIYGPEILKFLVKTQSYVFGTGAWVTTPSLDDGLYAIRGSTDKVPALIGLMTPGLGQPAAFTANTYQEILKVTVPNDNTGFLQELSVFSDQPGVCQWRITFLGSQLTNDQLIQTSAGWVYNNQQGKGLELPAGSEILAEAKSDGSTSVTATALITGTLES